MRESTRETLLEIARLIRRAELAPGVSAAAVSERVSGSKPGSSHLTFADDLPLAEAMERSLARWLDVWRRQVEGGGPKGFQGDSRSPAKREQTRAILAERGLDPTAVAFIYGMTTEAVRKLRGRYGLDPDTGLRLTELRQERVDGRRTRETPLTAPPRTAMDDLEARDQEGVKE